MATIAVIYLTLSLLAILYTIALSKLFISEERLVSPNVPASVTLSETLYRSGGESGLVVKSIAAGLTLIGLPPTFSPG